MAERGANFVLELIDRITAPARRMRDALRGLESVEKTTTAANAAAARAVDAVGRAADSTARKLAGLASAETRAAAAARFMSRMGAVHGPVFNPLLAGQNPGTTGEMFGPRRATVLERFRSQVVGLGKDFMSWNDGIVKQNEALGELWDKLGAGPLGTIGRGIKGIAGAAFDLSSELVSAAVSAGKLVLALGVIAAGMFVKRILELSNFAQKSKNALTALSHSTEQGAAQFAQARRIAGELGTSVEDVTHQFIELRAAQFSAEQTETILKLSRDLQALTGDAEGATRAVRAITQIKAKGRVQAEELLQLSEAGLSLELVYEQLMKSTGLGRNALRKQLESGKIDAVKGVAAIQAAIMTKLHEAKPGDFAKDISSKTLGGAWERLKSMPDVFMLDIAESINTEKLVAGIRVITQAFEAGGKSKLTEFAQKSIDLLGELIPLTVDFAEGFMSAFDGVLEGMNVLDAAGLKEVARTAGEYLAKFFGEALKFANAALPILKDSMGKFFDAIDWEGLTKAFLKVDWGKLAEDLMTIAAALLKISALTVEGGAGAVRGWQNSAKPAGDPTKDVSFGETVGANVAIGTLAGSRFGLAGTAAGAAAGAVRGVGQYVNDLWGNWYNSVVPHPMSEEDMRAYTPGGLVQSGAGPQASLRPGISSNQFKTEVNITAPAGADEKKLARMAREEVEKGLRGFATGELSEAVPV